MDGLTFYKIIRILNERYAESTLNNIFVLEDSMYLTLYKEGKKAVLCYNAKPPCSFSEVRDSLGESHSALSNINSAEIKLFKSRGYDRVAYMRIQKRRPSGKINTFTLVFEPAGGYANAFLLNEDGMIQFRLTSKSIDPDRDIGIGKIYQPPKQNKELSLIKTKDSENFLDFIGFYPLTAEIASALATKYGFSKAKDMIIEALDSESVFYKTINGEIVPFQDVESSLKEISFDELTQNTTGKNKLSEQDTLKKNSLNTTKHSR